MICFLEESEILFFEENGTFEQTQFVEVDTVSQI